MKAVLSGSRGAELCCQDLGVQSCAVRILGCRAVLSGSRGEGCALRCSGYRTGWSGAVWGSCVYEQLGLTFSVCVSADRSS